MSEPRDRTEHDEALARGLADVLIAEFRRRRRELEPSTAAAARQLPGEPGPVAAGSPCEDAA